MPGTDINSFLLGAASAYVFLKYRTHISERGAQISDHIKDIERLSSSAVELWSSEKDHFQKASEVQLHHTLAVKVFDLVKVTCHKRRKDYESLMYTLFTVTAWDEFLVNDEDAEPIQPEEKQAKVQEIVDTSTRLITLLRQVRADISSVEYLVWDTYHTVASFASWVKRDLLTP